jgi:hypothetical protein
MASVRLGAILLLNYGLVRSLSAIYIAAHDCASLLGDAVPITVERYLRWLSATEPGLVTEFTDPAGTIPVYMTAV